METKTFAKQVMAVAAKQSGAARFGANKVFISALAKHFAMPTADFKTALVAAHRAGHLELSRADLVQAMDADMVRDSETRYMTGEFHLVYAP